MLSGLSGDGSGTLIGREKKWIVAPAPKPKEKG